MVDKFLLKEVLRTSFKFTITVDVVCIDDLRGDSIFQCSTIGRDSTATPRACASRSICWNLQYFIG